MNSLVALAASLLCLGAAAPAFADGNGMMQEGSSFLGSSTAVVIDIPEGMVVHSLWYTPKTTSHTLAIDFGDEHGLGQRLAGLALGCPVGFLWGIPLGAIHGGRHALSTGWDKPFSTEAYIVNE